MWGGGPVGVIQIMTMHDLGEVGCLHQTKIAWRNLCMSPNYEGDYYEDYYDGDYYGNYGEDYYGDYEGDYYED